MPTRLFDQLDIINIVDTYSFGPQYVNCSGSLVSSSFSSLGISGSGSTTDPDPSCWANFTFVRTGHIDFTIFPTIPTNAKITDIAITLTGNSGASGAANSSLGGGCEVIINRLSGAIGLPVIDNAVGSASASASGTQSGGTIHYDPPLSYSDFISDYGLVGLTLDCSVQATAAAVVGSFDASNAFNVNITDWSMEVTYEEMPFTFKLNVPQPVVAGDRVSLTSNGTSNPIDFTKVTSLTVGGIDVDSSLWIFSEFFFSFPVPDYSTLGVLEIVITSTEFSGSMSLGKITTILFLGASGIYTLDPTATHDTLYDIVNGGTVNVKIPDPFIKTFFAGS